MNNRYLVKIDTVTGKRLFIDGEDQVITEEYLIDNPWFDENIVFMMELHTANAAAKLYGGKVIKCVMTVKDVSE